MVDALLVFVAILFLVVLKLDLETGLDKFTLSFLDSVHAQEWTHDLL